MKMILLDEQKFNTFATNHQNASFYQSSNYGNFMTKHGHNAYYLGLVNENDEVLAATLLLVDNDSRNKIGYAPRGFLIDWEDTELVKKFTFEIKDFASKRNFTSIKIDPKIIYKTHDLKGNIINNDITNTELVKRLQSLGYIHMGFNNGFEARKPRWDSRIILNDNINNLFNTLPSEARKKIYTAYNLGIKIYKGSSNDIQLFYDLLNIDNPPIDYYMDLYQFFNSSNSFDLYFAKINTADYVNSSKNAYEKEEQRNNDLNYKIQIADPNTKEYIINQKLESDTLLAQYKKNMTDAINIFQTNPNGIILASTLVLKFGKNVSFFMTAINDKGKENYSEYLLKWQLIEYYAKEGYNIIDINGMNGIFSEEYSNLVKHEISNNIVEYIGEFDLVINKKSYYTGSKLNPIINWLNTPI